MNTEALNTKTIPLAVQQDWFLQSLVDWANCSEFKVGITLQVSGLLVSGILVGIEEYFKTFGEDFASSLADPKVSEEQRSFFASLGNMPEKEKKDDHALPQYIHLKNVHLFHPSGNPIPRICWRGRISEVSGFAPGCIESRDVILECHPSLAAASQVGCSIPSTT